MKSNKNDFIDAEAIAEAVERENMRFVPIKTDDQLDLQGIHRVRDRLISWRTAEINQIRAFLLERGMTFAQRSSFGQVSSRRIQPFQGAVLSQALIERIAGSVGDRLPAPPKPQAQGEKGYVQEKEAAALLGVGCSALRSWRGRRCHLRPSETNSSRCDQRGPGSCHCWTLKSLTALATPTANGLLRMWVYRF